MAFGSRAATTHLPIFVQDFGLIYLPVSQPELWTNVETLCQFLTVLFCPKLCVWVWVSRKMGFISGIDQRKASIPGELHPAKLSPSFSGDEFVKSCRRNRLKFRGHEHQPMSFVSQFPPCASISRSSVLPKPAEISVTRLISAKPILSSSKSEKWVPVIFGYRHQDLNDLEELVTGLLRSAVTFVDKVERFELDLMV
jgi:hypothetical protein